MNTEYEDDKLELKEAIQKFVQKYDLYPEVGILVSVGSHTVHLDFHSV